MTRWETSFLLLYIGTLLVKRPAQYINLHLLSRLCTLFVNDDYKSIQSLRSQLLARAHYNVIDCDTILAQRLMHFLWRVALRVARAASKGSEVVFYSPPFLVSFLVFSLAFLLSFRFAVTPSSTQVQSSLQTSTKVVYYSAWFPVGGPCISSNNSGYAHQQYLAQKSTWFLTSLRVARTSSTSTEGVIWLPLVLPFQPKFKGHPVKYSFLLAKNGLMISKYPKYNLFNFGEKKRWSPWSPVGGPFVSSNRAVQILYTNPAWVHVTRAFCCLEIIHLGNDRTSSS